MRTPAPPKEHHRTISMVLLPGPRGMRFVMSKVPLCVFRHSCFAREKLDSNIIASHTVHLHPPAPPPSRARARGAESAGRAVVADLRQRRVQALSGGAGFPRLVPYRGEGGREEGEERAGETFNEASLEGDARYGEAVAGERDLQAHGAFSVALEKELVGDVENDRIWVQKGNDMI